MNLEDIIDDIEARLGDDCMPRPEDLKTWLAVLKDEVAYQYHVSILRAAE